MIEVLLRNNVAQLGRIGDIVAVRPGYARNYLFPHHLAVPVTDDNRRMVEKRRKVHAASEEVRMTEARQIAEVLSSLSLEIRVKTTDQGHLYGSVTARTIADALEEQGHTIDMSSIRLKQNIDEIGIYEVPVHVHSEVETTLQVKVTPA